MNEKEKLMHEIFTTLPYNADAIADFILADRKRIVEPLVKIFNDIGNLEGVERAIIKEASYDVLKRVGL